MRLGWAAGPRAHPSRSIQPVPLWTQQLRVSWRHPLVSFVSDKGAILRDLEDQGVLWRYVAEEERVGVKVNDALHQLVFGPSSFEILALKQAPDMDALVSAAKIVWSRLKPTEVRRADSEFRFVAPLSAGYDQARRDIGDRIVPMPEGVRNVDFAVIADLSVDEPNAEIQVQCGIVTREEAAGRLAMTQEALREGQGIAPSVFPVKSLPEVGFFDQQGWRISDLDLVALDGVLGIWSTAREKAEEIDVALFDQWIGDSDSQ